MAADKLKLEVVLSAIDKLTRPLDATRGKSRELAAQIKQTNDRLKELDRTQAQLASGKLPLSQESLAAAMRDAHAESTRLNESLLAQKARLDALNRSSQRAAAIRASGERISRTRDKLAGSGAGMIAAGGVTLAGVGTTVAAYAEAEDAATALRGAMMRADNSVPDTFRQINDLATRLGDKLPGTTADFQNMMTMLIRQGMSAESILGGLGEATAYLAVQMKMPTDQAAEFAAKMQDATRTTEKDMMGLMDVIQKAFYAGVDENNMLNAFAKLSPALGILKKEGLEGARVLAPLIAMADQAGMAGEASGNAYRKVFQMSMDAVKVAKGAKIAGVNLQFADKKGEFAGLDNLFAQLAKFRSLSTEKRLAAIKKIYGDDAETLQVVSLLIDKGKSGYAEMAAKMSEQASLQSRVNEQLSTLKNEWDAASGTFTNLLAQLGSIIAPELKVLAQDFGEVSSRMREWAIANPGLASALMKMAVVTGVLLVVLGGLAIGAAALLAPFAMLASALPVFAAIGSMVAGAFGLITGAVSTCTAFLLANPIILLITAIAVAALLVWKYWEPIKGFFIDLWSSITTAFTTAWNWLTGKIASFREIGANLIAGLVDGVLGKLGAVKDAIMNAGGAVIGWFKEKLGIHSPSRVFEQLGLYTMQGLENGLEAGRPGVGAVMADTSASMVRGASSGGGGGMGGATFNIYPSAGMDESALAQMIADKVEAVMRAGTPRSRSLLMDVS